MIRVKVPKLDANIEEVTVTEWLKHEGDHVRKGEPLAEFTTDKACVEFESPGSGIVRRIVAGKKSTVPVGFVIALIGAADDPLPEVAADNEKLLSARRQSLRAAKKTAPAAPASCGPKLTRVRASPAARRLARELNIDLTSLQEASGGGVITESTIEAYRKRGKNEPER